MANPQALVLFRQAVAASRANDKTKTRALLSEATALDPANETAWQWLAGVADSPHEAVAAWERVLTLNPGNDKARAALRPVRLQAGIKSAKEKDIPTARRLLRAVVADEPESEHGWLWLASVCESPSEAMSHLKRVIAINPMNKSARKGIDYYEAKIARASGGTPTPAERQTPDPDPAAEPARPADSELLRPRPERRRVLVVDASRTCRKVVGLTLERLGYDLTEAEDAAEAIDRIRDDGVPDLIVLDSKMTGMDPYEFCKLLRQHPDTRRLPVVLTAAQDSLVDKFRSKMAGVSALVTKPVHPEQLAETVRGAQLPLPAATRPPAAPVSAAV